MTADIKNVTADFYYKKERGSDKHLRNIFRTTSTLNLKNIHKVQIVPQDFSSGINKRISSSLGRNSVLSNQKSYRKKLTFLQIMNSLSNSNCLMQVNNLLKIINSQKTTVNSSTKKFVHFL